MSSKFYENKYKVSIHEKHVLKLNHYKTHI